MNRLTPQVGAWYRDLQQNNCFEVVAIDEEAQTVETQLLDGALCEYDLDSWHDLLLQPVAEPEDWRDAYELSEEDYIDPDSPIHPEDWNGPLNSIEPDVINGLTDDNY